MEILGYLHAQAVHEEERGIEYNLPNLQLGWPRIPSSAWLSFLAAGMLIAGQGFQSFAIAHNRVQTPHGGCLNARSGPGMEYGVHTCVRNGATLLPVVGLQGNWLQLSSGRWVYGPFTSDYSGQGGDAEDVRHINSVLRRGSTGGAVRQVQQSLESLGYSPGGIDGIFGPRTEEAVRQFQAEQGLVMDGIVGSDTQLRLFGSSST